MPHRTKSLPLREPSHNFERSVSIQRGALNLYIAPPRGPQAPNTDMHTEWRPDS